MYFDFLNLFKPLKLPPFKFHFLLPNFDWSDPKGVFAEVGRAVKGAVNDKLFKCFAVMGYSNHFVVFALKMAINSWLNSHKNKIKISLTITEIK